MRVTGESLPRPATLTDTELTRMAFKKISLNKGFVTIVDESDYDMLMQWKWYIHGTHVARPEYLGSYKGKKKYKTHYMHRVIMDTPDGMETDHINGNGLDNRRSNLRICTLNQNHQNRKRYLGTSIYKGVDYHKGTGKWRVRIGSGNGIHIGLFSSEIEAALAYNKAAIQHYKEFARLNVILEK